MLGRVPEGMLEIPNSSSGLLHSDMLVILEHTKAINLPVPILANGYFWETLPNREELIITKWNHDFVKLRAVHFWAQRSGISENIKINILLEGTTSRRPFRRRQSSIPPSLLPLAYLHYFRDRQGGGA
jgi:hypothetical protein